MLSMIILSHVLHLIQILLSGRNSTPQASCCHLEQDIQLLCWEGTCLCLEVSGMIRTYLTTCICLTLVRNKIYTCFYHIYSHLCLSSFCLACKTFSFHFLNRRHDINVHTTSLTQLLFFNIPNDSRMKWFFAAYMATLLWDKINIQEGILLKAGNLDYMSVCLLRIKQMQHL